MGKIQFSVTILFVFFLTNVSLAQQSTRQDSLKELLRRIDILTEEIENIKFGEAETQYESRYGMGPAASKVYQLAKPGVSIAGYGEVVYNNFSGDQDNGMPSYLTNQIDYLRHVTYLGFRFNDWLLLNVEIEFEHAQTSEEGPGEVAVEFGYVEAMLHKAINFRAGMVLVPVGIINEFHEPSTFHGALRPETERRIIPTTWRANGLGLVGVTQKGIGYKLYLVESLNAANFSSDGIRDGRQNGAEAIAEDLAITGRINYSGIVGIDLGGSFFVGNTGQTLVDSLGNKIEANLSLFSLHLMFARAGLELRGLYALSTLDDVVALNNVLGFSRSSSVGKKQQGFYITIAYDVMPWIYQGSTHYLAPFVQYEKFNTQDDVPSGFSQNPARERSNLTFGLTYKPHTNVALKLDYINRKNVANTAVDQFNLAMNYLF